MKSVDINATLRTDLGKKAAKNARKEGFVPGVIYGGEEVIHFNANPKDLKAVVYTSEFKKANIVLDGKTYTCILKDAQFHPVSDSLLHIDFLQLVEGKKLKANIPIRCEGVAEGVKAGGRLSQKLRKVTVKTTPNNLVEELLVDVTALNLGDSVRVKDIQFNDEMEVMNSPNIPVATIEVPRSMRSAASAADAAASEGDAQEEQQSAPAEA